MTKATKATAVTIQYEVYDRQDRPVVKERTFPSEAALERWTEKFGGNVTILRYSFAKEQN